jgi:NAD(P)-dependent dehydrogenase (short-subunit alcohol dehydrogenase family)
MELRGSTVLILGGSGLVGMAVARRLREHAPAKLIIAGLTREETEAGVRELRADSTELQVEAVWGDIFLPADLATRSRSDILADDVARRRLVAELLTPTPESTEQNLLYQWLTRFRPDAVVDCVNTATAFAYRDIFTSSRDLLAAADKGALKSAQVERHVLTLYIPQLIRHMQIFVEGMQKAATQAYVKIGTAGTGGMGFNIPYTHSEEHPSPTLMAKSAVAGAQSLFLFLLGRTPNAPAIIEIKPTAAIGWREIGYGPIRRGGRTIDLVDCEKPIPLDVAFTPEASGWSKAGGALENVFINVGENGLFAREEFETVSALGQMELVTPEEIADTVVMELRGRPTGKNIVAALDGATFGPTYRAGYLRAVAIEGLQGLEQKHGVRSIAFEMLGPPRLTKLLYEAYILSKLCPSVTALARSEPETLASAAERLLRTREHVLRQQILSVGLPILMADGRAVLRGPTVVVQPNAGGGDVAPRGWVDLRPANMTRWIWRASTILGETRKPGTGSSARWTAVDPGDELQPARLAVWIFENEDGGYRIKR